MALGDAFERSIVLRDEATDSARRIRSQFRALNTHKFRNAHSELTGLNRFAYRIGNEFGTTLGLLGVRAEYISGGFVNQLSAYGNSLNQYARESRARRYTAVEIGLTAKEFLQFQYAAAATGGVDMEEAGRGIETMARSLQDLARKGDWSETWQRFLDVGGQAGTQIAAEFAAQAKGNIRDAILYVYRRMRSAGGSQQNQAWLRDVIVKGLGIGTPAYMDSLNTFKSFAYVVVPTDEASANLIQEFTILDMQIQVFQTRVAVTLMPPFTKLLTTLVDALKGDDGAKFRDWLSGMGQSMQDLPWDAIRDAITMALPVVGEELSTFSRDFWMIIRELDALFVRVAGLATAGVPPVLTALGENWPVAMFGPWAPFLMGDRGNKLKDVFSQLWGKREEAVPEAEKRPWMFMLLGPSSLLFPAAEKRADNTEFSSVNRREEPTSGTVSNETLFGAAEKDTLDDRSSGRVEAVPTDAQLWGLITLFNPWSRAPVDVPGLESFARGMIPRFLIPRPPVETAPGIYQRQLNLWERWLREQMPELERTHGGATGSWAPHAPQRHGQSQERRENYRALAREVDDFTEQLFWLNDYFRVQREGVGGGNTEGGVARIGRTRPMRTKAGGAGGVPREPRTPPVFPGDPPAGRQTVRASWYGQYPTWMGSIIPRGWTDPDDVHKSGPLKGQSLGNYGGYGQDVPGVALPYRGSAGRPERLEGKLVRVWDLNRIGPGQRSYLARQVDIGPNQARAPSKYKGIDINAPLAEKMGYVHTAEQASETGRPVFPTGGRFGYEVIRPGPQMMRTMRDIDVERRHATGRAVPWHRSRAEDAVPDEEEAPDRSALWRNEEERSALWRNDEDAMAGIDMRLRVEGEGNMRAEADVTGIGENNSIVIERERKAPEIETD